MKARKRLTDNTKPNTNMKTQILTTLLCMSLISSAMAGDSWDLTRNHLHTNQPTHAWENLNGSKTYRYDSQGTTSFDTRSAQSVATEAQFKQDLAVIAVALVLAGANALCEWWNTQPTMTNLNR